MNEDVTKLKPTEELLDELVELGRQCKTDECMPDNIFAEVWNIKQEILRRLFE